MTAARKHPRVRVIAPWEHQRTKRSAYVLDLRGMVSHALVSPAAVRSDDSDNEQKRGQPYQQHSQRARLWHWAEVPWRELSLASFVHPLVRALTWFKYAEAQVRLWIPHAHVAFASLAAAAKDLAGAWEQGVRSREQGTGNREPASRSDMTFLRHLSGSGSEAPANSEGRQGAWHWQWDWPKQWLGDIATFLIVSFMLLSPLALYEARQELKRERSSLFERTNAIAASLTPLSVQAKSGNVGGMLATLGKIQTLVEEVRMQLDAPSTWTGSVMRMLPGSHAWKQARVASQAAQSLTRSTTAFVGALESLQRSDDPWSVRIHEARARLEEAQTEFDRADMLIQGASLARVLPEIDEMLQQAKPVSSGARERLHRIARVVATLDQALEAGRFQRYLVVFQNTGERRPSGGFIGSLSLVDVTDGVITHTEFPKGGPYDFEGALKLKEQPPSPLATLRPFWQLQDMNWYYDWPTSAQAIARSYEYAGGPTVDGVVAISSPALPRLLDVMGPVEVEGRALNAQNVIIETQRAVEFEYDRAENSPKKFIGDLAEVLSQRIVSLPPDRLPELFTLLEQAVAEKHFMVYSRDEALERSLAELGVAGEVAQTAGEYLAIIDANIGGGKTNSVIEETVRHRALLGADGQWRVRLSSKRVHRGERGALFTGMANVSYLRVYVPLGSRLLDASGFIFNPRVFKASQDLLRNVQAQEYPGLMRSTVASTVVETTEFGKTVFGGWLRLKPGEESTWEMLYALPRTVSQGRSATLYWQKQPGALGQNITHEWIVPSSMVLAQIRPEARAIVSRTATTTTIRFDDTLNKDRFYGMVFR